jgi:hypothetical protein
LIRGVLIREILWRYQSGKSLAHPFDKRQNTPCDKKQNTPLWPILPLTGGQRFFIRGVSMEIPIWHVPNKRIGSRKARANRVNNNVTVSHRRGRGRQARWSAWSWVRLVIFGSECAVTRCVNLGTSHSRTTCLRVCVCRGCVCVFITAVPIIKVWKYGDHTPRTDAGPPDQIMGIPSA